MKKKLMVLSGVVLGLSPVVALAQTRVPQSGTLFTILGTISDLLNTIVPVLVALGVVYFVWGVVSYVVSSDEEAKKTGRNRMIWGIIGLAVIVGMWGLVNILGKTFGINSQNTNNPGTIVLPGVELR